MMLPTLSKKRKSGESASSTDLQKFASNPVSENMTSRIELFRLLDIYKNII